MDWSGDQGILESTIDDARQHYCSAYSGLIARSFLLLWSICSYNIAGSTLQRSSADLAHVLDADVLFFQSTGEATTESGFCYSSSDPGYVSVHFPYLKNQSGTNKACGVNIMLHKRRFSLADIIAASIPPPCLQGRAGAIRVRRRGLFDFFVHCAVHANFQL